MELLRSVLREGKVLGLIAVIMAVVWTAGYSGWMDEQARRLDRLPRIELGYDDSSMSPSVETAQLDDFPPAD